MPPYKAKPGQSDPHGEMTGAISINLVFTALPVTIWAVFVGPMFFDDVRWKLLSSVLLGVALTLIGFPISRRVWARLSDWMDRCDF